jgi:hypothetical protein
VYDSGLAGVTAAQYKRLREAEPQVRINETLMSLVDIPVSLTPPDVDVESAAQHLREVGIKPEALLEAF